MKDYYKTLGVKESASEEEIREHWIEWVRKLHPDQHQGSGIEDERIRAVNEAYQVLKHSSTRVEYDLKRAHDRRRKGFRFRRISILIVVFCFLIPALLYVKKVTIGVSPVSSTEHQTIVLREAGRQDLEVLRNGTIEPVNAGHPEEVDATTQEALGVETGPASKTEPDGKRIGPKPGRPRPADERMNSIGRKIFDKEVRAEKADRPQGEVGIPAPEWIQVSSAPVPQVEAGVNILPWIEGPDGFSLPNEGEGEPSADDPVSMAASAPQKSERPAPLLAAEDEIRRFLSLYTERYMQKDLEGFLSLFSQRAVQNGKDGFERIRAIYADFLHRSKEIRYRLYDAKIEIYQNGVEVKSLYELTQRPGAGGRERAWRGRIRWVLTKENGALKILSLDYQSQETR